MKEIQKILALQSGTRQATRDWFSKRDFLEISSPLLSVYSSLEKYIYPVVAKSTDEVKNIYTHFLRVSPELSLKKIVSPEIPKIFELGKCFRSGEGRNSPHHLVEFTLLEWYEVGMYLHQLMDHFTEFVNHLFGKELSWKKISMREAFLQYAKIDFDKLQNWEELISIAAERQGRSSLGASQNMTGKECVIDSLDDSFYWLYLNEVEVHLRKSPTIIYDYPSFQASFSKLHRGVCGKEYGRRFEAYLGGLEIANGFEELCNPKEQASRWQESIDWFQEEKYFADLDVEWKMDPNFLAALERMEEYDKNFLLSGIAVGWDRLMLLLSGKEDLRDLWTV